MIKYFIFLLTIFSLNAIAQREGTGSTGGGSGVLLLDGTVITNELLPSNLEYYLPRTAKNDVVVKNIIFANKNRYIKTWGKYDNSFFDCAKKIIKTHKPNGYKEWLKGLDQVKTIRWYPFMKMGSDSNSYGQVAKEMAEANGIPQIGEADDTNPLHQVTLAVYSEGLLLFQSDLFDRMNNENKCALSVHEALRVLNNSNLVPEKLISHEILKYTYYLMNYSQEHIEKLGKKINGNIPIKLERNYNFGKEYEEYINRKLKTILNPLSEKNEYIDIFTGWIKELL